LLFPGFHCAYASMLCNECQLRYSNLHMTARYSYTTRLVHKNLGELASCADLEECQLCVVAYYKALTCLESPDTIDRKKARLAELIYCYDVSEKQKGAGLNLSFKLQMTAGVHKWGPNPDWGDIPTEYLTHVGREVHYLNMSGQS